MAQSKNESVPVLGQSMADAMNVEAQRLAAGPNSPSPIPKAKYGGDEGGRGLLVVKTIPLDIALRSVVKDFRSWDVPKREAVRASISMDELYLLIHFAKRCAVLALSEEPELRCMEGLTAIAMLDPNRIDPRDAAWSLGLLRYAAAKLGGERTRLFEEAAAIAAPSLVELLSASHPSSHLSNWGFAEYRTDSGVGLIEAGTARYEPTVDLTSVALRIAEQLPSKRYVGTAEIASNRPNTVWFRKDERDAAQAILRQSRATIQIRGDIHQELAPFFSQMFVQWIVELPSPESAAALASQVAVEQSGRFVKGVAHGSLFALLVAGSTTEGVAAVETPESLAQLAEQTRAIMAEAKST